jgi:hypothetical protein
MYAVHHVRHVKTDCYWIAMTAVAHDTFEGLEIHLPVPILPVKWHHGWVCNIGLQRTLEAVEKARHDMCSLVFIWATLDTTQKLHAIEVMERYAIELVIVCKDAHFDTTNSRRSRPLEFEWCFPGEPDPLSKLTSASMRSTLPAFEYACVSSCICIAHGEAGMFYSTSTHTYALAIVQFELCMQRCRLTVETLLQTVTNSAQWARLRRQGLPLQLLPSWLNLLASRVNHKAQIHSIQQVATQDESNERNTTLVYLARGAEDSACRIVVSARALLLDQKFLLQTQVDIATAYYLSAVEEAHRVRVQCLLQDAEYALFSGNSGFVCILLHDCLVSAKLAFMREVDDHQMVAVSKAVEELKQLSILSSSVPTSSDDECVQIWRAQLQRRRYSEIQP